MDRCILLLIPLILVLIYAIQAKFSQDELVKLAKALEVSPSSIDDEIGAHWWPHRGLGPIPPTDPVIYRLYEVRHTPPLDNVFS